MEVAASTDIGPGTRLLLGLWRGIHGAGYCAQGDEDWESLLAACSYHQVSPIVFHRLQNRSGHRCDPARSETQVRCLEAELYFYGKVLGFEPADELQPVEIES